MYASIPIGSTIAVQSKDGGQWTHGTIDERADITTMTDHTPYQ